MPCTFIKLKKKEQVCVNTCIIVASLFVTHQVGFAGCMVLLCAHTNEAVVVKENAERVTGSDEDVDPQVKLVALHQEGLV